MTSDNRIGRNRNNLSFHLKNDDEDNSLPLCSDLYFVDLYSDLEHLNLGQATNG